MSKVLFKTLIVAAVLFLFTSGRVLAAEQLRELSGTSFHCEVHPWLEGSLLGADSQAGYSVAELLGMQVLNISGLELRWPKSEKSCRIFSGQYGDMLGSGGRPIETSICIGLSDSGMQVVNLDGVRTAGFLSKLCVWPDKRSAEAKLIVLASFSDGYEESVVQAFSIAVDGTTERVETGSAKTQWGEFQVADLDDNGSYELMCYRNLDGMLGGLSYRSVRGYDAASNSYSPAAEKHKRFFELERDWLDWVIATRLLVIANPTAYVNEAGSGAYYQATYNGVSYGFDTIVFIDNSSYDREMAREADYQTREAFRKVRGYRDELNIWLGGGAEPQTWGVR